MVANQRNRLILGLPTKKPAAFLAGAKVIYNAFEANVAMLPSPVPSLANVKGQIQELDTAQQAVKTRTVGLVPARDIKLGVVVTSMESWRMYGQTLIDANPEQAEAIAKASGMLLAKEPVHAKPLLQAKPGPQPGTVVLSANATLLVGRKSSKRATFNWELSADGGKTWTAAPSTPLAKTLITGLTSLTTYAFRVCVTVSNVTGEWSQAVTLLVK